MSIKIGAKPNTGNESINLSSGAKLQTVGLGMVTKNDSVQEEKKLPLIELTNEMVDELIQIAVDDLSAPRILNVNGSPITVRFIKEYNPRTRYIIFEHSIKEINSFLQINEEDLSEFFSTFLFSNITKYIKNKWQSRPEKLPILSFEEVGDSKMGILISIR